MKKTTEESVVSERKKRPKSKSRPKSKLKKKTKIEAKMPKKPLTTFFYFLEDFHKEFQEQNPNITSMRNVEKCMARLQELQLTVTGGSKIISGVSLSPRSTRGYMRTSLRCKQESLRMKNSTPRKSPVGKFSATAGVVDNKTKNTSEDPKTPLIEHRKQRYQFLKSLMEKDDLKCGQNAVVERKSVLVPKSETIVHVIVTNVKTFDYQLSNSDMKPIKEGLNGLKTTRKQRSKGRK
ncbi:hypothetical protein Gotur_022108 [Gossypium turneri]